MLYRLLSSLSGSNGVVTVFKCSTLAISDEHVKAMWLGI